MLSAYRAMEDIRSGGGALLVSDTLRGELRQNESMRRHCSWKAGGNIHRFYIPADLADLQHFLTQQSEHEALYIIGLGSNLLVRDGGFTGTIVLTHSALSGIEVQSTPEGALVSAEAGVAAPKVARFAARHDFEGAEFLAGIPGTVGGALAMNAGCYGSETWTHVFDVTTIDRSGKLHIRTPQEYEVSYRHVIEKASDPGNPLSPLKEWFVSARFLFEKGDGKQSSEKIKELLKRRIASQPLQQPNAGSVFRNPQGDFAARLIELCGLKGFTVGQAQVSPRHANFIVNLGDATACDIENLLKLIENRVREETGIVLQREVQIIGEALQ
jgi:UDP-N-acetylmuramate dehydrogenase